MSNKNMLDSCEKNGEETHQNKSFHGQSLVLHYRLTGVYHISASGDRPMKQKLSNVNTATTCCFIALMHQRHSKEKHCLEVLRA